MNTEPNTGWNLHTLNCPHCRYGLTGPFTIISRSVNWIVIRGATRSLLRRPLAAYGAVAVLWVVAPAVFWCLWMSIGTFTNRNFGTSHEIFGMHWQIALAATWLFFGPFIIYVWESLFGSTLCRIRRTCLRDGWEISRLDRMTRFARRTSLPIPLVISALALACYLLTLRWVDGLIIVAQDQVWWHVVGALLVTWEAFTLGVGFWIMVIAVASAKVLPSKSLHWYPFKGRQIDGIEALSSFAFWCAFFLSLAVLWAPMMLILLRTMPLQGKVILIPGATVAAFGGLLTFILPTSLLALFVQRQKAAMLLQMSDELDRLDWNAPHWLDGTNDSARLEVLLAKRTAVAAARAVPRPMWTAWQLTVLIVLPLALNLLITKLF